MRTHIGQKKNLQSSVNLPGSVKAKFTSGDGTRNGKNMELKRLRG
jgi:hypothetical protein